MIARLFRRRDSSIWKSRSFLNLWTAAAISSVGDQVTRLALPIIAISTLHAGSFEVGLLLTIGQLPQLLFSLHAGAWIDRLPKKPVLIICDTGRALVLAAVPIAAWFNWLNLPCLFVIGFLAGVFQTWHMIAWQSILPLMLRGDQMMTGMSAITQVEAIAEVGGPATGGGLIQLVGAPAAVLMDAVSFLGSAALITQIPAKEEISTVNRAPILGEIRSGFRYLLNEPILRAIGLSGCLGVLFYAIREPLLRVFLLDDKNLSAGRYGLVFTLSAIGYAIGSFLPGPVARRFGVGNAIVWPHVGFVLSAIGIAAAAMIDRHAVLVIALMLLIEGVAEPINNVNQLTLRLSLMPKEMRGRLTSIVRFLIRGAYPIGALIGGLAGDVLGVRNALWLTIFSGIFGAAAYIGSPIFSFHRLPEAPES